ncbi:4Fe-4S binding protein [Saccharopolyspora rectivirgula]|uniref:4Fe-4S binding protein n=1 Tax=Saccharopolyspora rectivirgula TaxID=28042 RepID=UPI0009DD91EF|nr:4Fe-4S binding protein [Saccharopolyspora rectivirgula]
MPDERLVVSSACTACGACLLTCPEHALRPAPGRPRVLDERCTACGECVEVCPADALRLVSASASPTPPGTEPRAW